MRKISMPNIYHRKFYVLETIGDGNCFFHAILQSFLEKYQQFSYSEKRNYVKKFRLKLAKKLDDYYDILNNGNMKIFGNSIEEFSLESMKKKLISFSSLGYGFLDYLSRITKKNIYILDERTKNLYYTDEYLCRETKRFSQNIILLYDGGHFETLGLKKSKILKTCFDNDEKVIINLEKLIKDF